MPTFIPPSDLSVAAADRGDNSVAGRLFRYMSPSSRGRNVYRLVDGSFTEAELSDLSNVTRVFQGGHAHYVTDAEASQLIAAGYTVDAGVFELGSAYSSTLGGDAILDNIEGNTV